MIKNSLRIHIFIYHLSFVLIYTLSFFFGAFELFVYEDQWNNTASSPMWSWSSMDTSEKIGAIAFYVAQFPFGLLFGLITGNYGNFLFACVLNPIVLSWLLRRFVEKKTDRHINATIRTNAIILIMIIILLVWEIAL